MIVKSFANFSLLQHSSPLPPLTSGRQDILFTHAQAWELLLWMTVVLTSDQHLSIYLSNYLSSTYSLDGLLLPFISLNSNAVSVEK